MFRWELFISDKIKQVVQLGLMKHWEKARWELHKNAVCCFEPHKTAAVWPLTSHLANHSSRHAGEVRMYSLVTFYELLHRHTSVEQPAKTHIHQLRADTGCHLQDFSRAMARGDRWQESQRNSCCQQTLMMMSISIYV